MNHLRGETGKNQMLIEGLFCVRAPFSTKALRRPIHASMRSLNKLIQNSYYVSGVCSVSDETESMNKMTLSKSINHLCIKMPSVSSLELDNQQIINRLSLSPVPLVAKFIQCVGGGPQGMWPKRLRPLGGGVQ